MLWNVYADASGLWNWEMLDAHARQVAHSARGFQSRDECLADARRHGYTGEHQGPCDHGSDEPESR
jgi:hypothetical protein